jgi:DNA transformation protein and related proteins
MFGGTGVYADGVMFALEAYGEIYLKVDTVTKPAFEEAGSRPFVYEKAGRRSTMSYWLLPPDALEDPEEIVRWSRLAFEAAQRRPEGARGRRG